MSKQDGVLGIFQDPIDKNTIHYKVVLWTLFYLNHVIIKILGILT